MFGGRCIGAVGVSTVGVVDAVVDDVGSVGGGDSVGVVAADGGVAVMHCGVAGGYCDWCCVVVIGVVIVGVAIVVAGYIGGAVLVVNTVGGVTIGCVGVVVDGVGVGAVVAVVVDGGGVEYAYVCVGYAGVGDVVGCVVNCGVTM